MKKEYLKPDAELIKFVISNSLMNTLIPSIEIGEGEEGEEEY